jgi:hypothetical protein
VHQAAILVIVTELGNTPEDEQKRLEPSECHEVLQQKSEMIKTLTNCPHKIGIVAIAAVEVVEERKT